MQLVPRDEKQACVCVCDNARFSRETSNEMPKITGKKKKKKIETRREIQLSFSLGLLPTYFLRKICILFRKTRRLPNYPPRVRFARTSVLRIHTILHRVKREKGAARGRTKERVYYKDLPERNCKFRHRGRHFIFLCGSLIILSIREI